MFYKNVCESFLLSVRKAPERTAIIYKDERISYAEANARINRIANALLALGIKSGDKVAYLFPNCSEIVLVYYALQKIGAVAVPLNFRLIAREIRLLVELSDSVCLIFSAQFADKVADAQLDTALTKICFGDDERFKPELDELCAAASDGEPELFADEDALSRIQFTGGSTGIPKGVMRTHRQDMWELFGEMMYCGIGAGAPPVVLIQCPLEHHGGHSWFSAVMAAGGTLIICSAYDPEEILRRIELEQVTHTLLLPPTTYLRLCEYAHGQKRRTESVRVAQSAAGGTTPEIVAQIETLFPNAEVYYGWGQTESGLGTSTILTAETCGDRCSVGRPMPFIEMKIIDDDWNELPPDTPGEAAVRSPAIMKGYYKHPELTAALMGKDGWMRTGDIMRRDAQGSFYMLSRKKNVVKSGGENVFCSDVECVVKMHPAVMECVVIGVPDERLGEAVTAVVQLREGASLSLEELQEHCKRYLSSYKKPLHLELVPAFDMDDAGKIRKEALEKNIRAKYAINI